MIPAFLLLILSAACGLLSYRLYKRQEAFAARATICEAEIVGYTDEYDHERHTTAYAPVYRYRGPDGALLDARSRIFREADVPPSPGGRLRIRLDPDHPGEAEAATAAALHWPGLLAGAFALFFLVAAVTALP